MAAGTKLVITFLDTTGTERIFSFRYAKMNATDAQVKTLVQTIIANGSIFTHVPVKAKSAILATTTETTMDISE